MKYNKSEFEIRLKFVLTVDTFNSNSIFKKFDS